MITPTLAVATMTEPYIPVPAVGKFKDEVRERSHGLGQLDVLSLLFVSQIQALKQFSMPQLLFP